jgi:hypothetical protein
MLVCELGWIVRQVVARSSRTAENRDEGINSARSCGMLQAPQWRRFDNSAMT